MKTKSIFVCQSCGAQAPRWVGKCPACQAWNSYVEEATFAPKTKRQAVSLSKDEPVLLKDISLGDEKRCLTGIGELDNVLGGGIVHGSVILIGGDPGIGKSTLALQMGCVLGRQGRKVLYVSGEESIRQTRMRAERLVSSSEKVVEEKTGKKDDSLYIVNQLNLNTILEYMERLSPQVVVIDSIQVVYNEEIASSPGSVSQVRECAAILTHFAKSKGISLFIIGHVTKEGMLAGPKVLEHIVDTVLYFEGERYSNYRVLRAAKNRFGSTNELGVFEMSAEGLAEVSNPSEIFLSERPQNSSGSVVAPILQGTRPFLVEIQGLVSRSSFGVVRQKAQGFDANRLALLVAVLEKRLQLNLQDKDIFLNVVGGVKVTDPAVDLSVVLAIASAFLDKPIAPETVVLGEVGLSAEVRSVTQLTSRVKEAAKLGFKRCIVPRNNLKNKTALDDSAIEICPVETVKEAMENM